MRFRHRCTGAKWNKQTSKWHVTFNKLDENDNVVESIEDVADVFMTGTGALNEWKWPDIPGLKAFKGKLMHSANYDSSYDVTVRSSAPYNISQADGRFTG